MDHIEQIARILIQVPIVANTASKEDPIEHETAYAVAEIAESGHRLRELVELLKSSQASEVSEAIVSEIVQELRHIVYHVRDSSFLNERVLE